MPHTAKQPCVYIRASRPNGSLYIGVTSTLFDRVSVHREDLLDGFTKRHRVHRDSASPRCASGSRARRSHLTQPRPQNVQTLTLRVES